MSPERSCRTGWAASKVPVEEDKHCLKQPYTFHRLLIEFHPFMCASQSPDNWAKTLSTFQLCNGTACLKNINNCLNINIYSFLETSGGQSSYPYLNVVIFWAPEMIRNLWQIKTAFFHALVSNTCCIYTHEGLWDQKELGQKFERLNWVKQQYCFRVYFSPSRYEVLVSTDYASTALLFPDSDEWRVRERKRNIGFQSKF